MKLNEVAPEVLHELARKGLLPLSPESENTLEELVRKEDEAQDSLAASIGRELKGQKVPMDEIKSRDPSLYRELKERYGGHEDILLDSLSPSDLLDLQDQGLINIPRAAQAALKEAVRAQRIQNLVDDEHL